ncbi:hypothetical protein L7F22_049614 [Adiantum nelumboides]|nr:hypothetical protein [Adiantum nelumboides]MCO5595569.1 hypothetical protein [Adiantum nelumboides]
MARWLIQVAALQYLKSPAAAAASSYISAPSSIVIAAGAVVISLCCVAIILSMCSFCDIRRERVGDKASSSDGDDHNTAPSASGKPQLVPFLMMTARKCSMSSPLKQTKEEGKAAVGADQVEQGKLSPQVWQRSILMGERCKRPNFSGLILYDEKGNLLPRRFPM